MRRNSCPWEKKGFHKKKKKHKKLFQLPTISNCPDLCPLTHIECWRTTELLLLPRTPSLSLSNALSLAHSLFFSISFFCFICLWFCLCLFFFFYGRFFFLFFGETKSARNGSHRCWWQASWRNSVLFELRWQAYGFPYIRVLEGEEGGSRCCSRCLHSDLQVRSTAFALMCSTLFTPQLLYMFLSCLFVNFLLLLFVRWPC